MNPDSGVTLGVITNPDGTRTAAYGGLKTCGSVWSCPVCAAKIATRRADDLATVMRAVDELGGSAFLLTLTMRHTNADRLGMSRDERRTAERLAEEHRDLKLAHANGWDDVTADQVQAAKDTHAAFLEEKAGCWDVLGYAWSAVTSGSSWQADVQLFGGLLGWARAVEVTHGTNGWHVHVHVLLCFREQVSADLAAATLGPRIFGRWNRALLRRGFSASEEHGWDLRRAQLGDGDLADYFTKMAHEVTSGYRKEAHRYGGRTPMQLLGDAVETYEETAVHRWWEWETASDGRRQLTWSTGTRDLRTLASLGRAATDEEIAEEDQSPDQCLVIHRDLWGEMSVRRLETTMLSIAEHYGLQGVNEWLRKQPLRSTAWFTGTSSGLPKRQRQSDRQSSNASIDNSALKSLI